MTLLARQLPTIAGTLCLTLLAVFLFASEPSPAPVGKSPPSDKVATSATPLANQRLRENSRLSDLEGRFEVIGERVTFLVAGSNQSFRILENLSLERVTRVLAETRTPPQWTIQATVTEYNGFNYLLLTKAVLKAPDNPGKAE